MIYSSYGSSTSNAQAVAAAAAAAQIITEAGSTAGGLPAGTVILATSEESGPDTSGNYVDGRSITFQIATGDIASVWVPYSQLNPTTVAAAIAAIATQMASIWVISNPGT